MQEISDFIQKNLDLIYDLIDKKTKLKISKKSEDYEVSYEILEYNLKPEIISLKLNKVSNTSNFNNIKGIVELFFSKNKNKEFENILNNIPNQVYRIKEKFKSCKSYGDSLSRVLSKNEVFNQIMQ